MDGHERNNPDWASAESEILRMVYWRDRCGLAEKLLQHVLTRKEIGRACHIHDLEIKVKKLQREVTHQREASEYRNAQLRAANLITYCTGGCKGGICGSDEAITEEVVAEVEMIAKRLRSWLINHNGRVKN